MYCFGSLGNSASSQPRGDGTGFPPRMSQLDTDLLALTMGKVDGIFQRGHLRILPQARVFRSDSTLWCYGSSFNHRQTWTPLDDSAKMSLVPCRVVPVYLLVNLRLSNAN